MLTNGSEINKINNPDLYIFLKESLNTIESNDSQANERLVNTFANLNKIIGLNLDKEKIAKIKNPYIKRMFMPPDANPTDPVGQTFNFKSFVKISKELSFHPLGNVEQDNPSTIENSEKRLSFGLLDINLTRIIHKHIFFFIESEMC